MTFCGILKPLSLPLVLVFYLDINFRNKLLSGMISHFAMLINMHLVTTRMTQFSSYGLLQQNTRSMNQSNLTIFSSLVLYTFNSS